MNINPIDYFRAIAIQPELNQERLPQEVNLSVGLCHLNEADSRKDYENIVKDTNLFWAKFCKTFAEKKSKSNERFDVKIVENQALIIGIDWMIPLVKESIELFRQLLLEAFETHCDVNRVIIPIVDNLFFRKPSLECIDLTDWLIVNVKDKISNRFYDYVKPYLHDFFESLAMDYSEVKTTQLVQTIEDLPAETKNVIAIKITLKKDKYFTYPIPPAIVPAVSHPDPSFYERYQSGKFCDYSLISSEGKQLKVHGIVLDIYGGSYFHTLFSAGLVETSEKSAKLDYPYELIQQIVDSIYLGPKHLEEKLINGEAVDVYGILQFAHTYFLNYLYKQAVNLLMLTAGPSDIEQIKHFANLYNDDDLHRLLKHLSPEKLIIKV